MTSFAHAVIPTGETGWFHLGKVDVIDVWEHFRWRQVCCYLSTGVNRCVATATHARIT
jgi:hypothetical protein